MPEEKKPSLSEWQRCAVGLRNCLRRGDRHRARLYAGDLLSFLLRHRLLSPADVRRCLDNPVPKILDKSPPY